MHVSIVKLLSSKQEKSFLYFSLFLYRSTLPARFVLGI